jgi:hypothetical protein
MNCDRAFCIALVSGRWLSVGLLRDLLRGEQDEKRTSIRMRECSRMRDEGRA